MATMGFPDYRKPPVVEVAISVQFDPIEQLTAAHAGLYWAGIRDVFGGVEEQAPILQQIERAFLDEVAPPLLMFGKPPMPRLWFVDKTSTRIIQVQRDKFVHNWRKMEPGDEYPRFSRIRQGFLSQWGGFLSFLEQNRLPQPNINQCELAYVNRIKMGEGWTSAADLDGVFAAFAWKTRYGFLPTPEKVQWAMHFALPEQNGRLHVEMVPVRFSPAEVESIQFVLTARGKPAGAIDQASIDRWFDLAHEWIVKGFADLVDKKTDRLWERLA
jgi:uncharacterized protein (TIGR04255 family)